MLRVGARARSPCRPSASRTNGVSVMCRYFGSLNCSARVVAALGLVAALFCRIAFMFVVCGPVWLISV